MAFGNHANDDNDDINDDNGDVPVNNDDQNKVIGKTNLTHQELFKIFKYQHHFSYITTITLSFLFKPGNIHPRKIGKKNQFCKFAATALNHTSYSYTNHYITAKRLAQVMIYCSVA